MVVSVLHFASMTTAAAESAPSRKEEVVLLSFTTTRTTDVGTTNAGFLATGVEEYKSEC